MIPHFLGLYNFKSHKHTEINFSSNTLYTIEGIVDSNTKRSNNSGKSSILEAISFAVFKTPAEKQGDYTLDELVYFGEKEAKIIYEFSTSVRVRITRTIKIGANGTASAKLLVETKNKEDIWEKFRSKSTSDTQDFIKKLIGMNQFVWFHTAMRSQFPVMEFLDTTKEKRAEIWFNISGYQEKIKAIQERIKEKLDFYNNAVSKVERETSVRSENIMENIKEIQEWIPYAENERKKLNEKIDKYGESSHKELLQLQTLSLEYKNRINEMESDAKGNLRTKINEAKSKLNDIINRKKDKVDEITNTINSKKEYASHLHEKHNNLCDFINKTPEEDITLPDEDFNTQLQEIKDEQDKVSETLLTIGQERRVLIERIKDLEAAGHSHCPILREDCDRVSVSVLETKLNEKKTEATEIDKQITEQLSAQKNADEAIKSINKSKDKVETIKNSIKEYNKVVRELEEFKEKYLPKIGGLDKEIKQYITLLEDISGVTKEEEDMKKQLSSLEETDYKDFLSESYNDVLDKIKGVNTKISELGEVEPINIDEVRGQINTLSDQIAEQKNIITEHNKSQVIVDRLNKRLGKFTSFRDTYKDVQYTFSKRGFIINYMAHSIPRLEGKMNEYLKFFDDGRLSVIIGDKIEIYDAVVGRRIKSGLLSGGQKALLNFCFNMANIYIRYSETPYSNCIFIDEGFDALDPSNLSSALSVMLCLFEKLNLSNILTISHKPFQSSPTKVQKIVIHNNNGAVHYGSK